MAEEQQKDHGTAFTEKVTKAASAGVQAVKAAAKAGAGDVAGAILEVLKSETFRNGLIAIILCFSLLTTCVAMMAGSAITGAVQSLAQSWSENWDEAWAEQGIASNGSVLYQYTIGAISAGAGAAWDTLKGLFKTDNIVGGEDRNNSSIEGGISFAENDYDKTIMSVTDEDALTAEGGAIKKRIEMVKGRLTQRGNQLIQAAKSQYSFKSIGIGIGEALANYRDNPVLFAGIDFDSCTINIDSAAFEMSDIQALKILAAYSVQHDVDLTEVSMWDFLDYCGWYGNGGKDILDSIEESIYNVSSDAVFGQEIGGVVQEGENATTIYYFEPPKVPVWTGTCAPQWYYEEISQINQHNEDYYFLKSQGAASTDSMIPWGVTGEDDDLDISAFAELDDVQTYGIIDRMFLSSESSLTIERTEYTGADEWARETIASLGSFISRLWDDTMGPKSATTSYGNTVKRDNDNNHSFTLKSGSQGSLKKDTTEGYIVTKYRYYLKNTTTGENTTLRSVSADGATLDFTGLSGDTTYKVMMQKTVIDNTPEETVPVPSRPGDGNISIMSESDISPQANGDVSPQAAGEETVTYYTIDTFTTFQDTSTIQAYQLKLTIDVHFSPRSVDDLTLYLLGLWPGSLDNTEYGPGGIEYAKGYTTFDNLQKTWTDSYTAPDGSVHTLDFERQYGHQIETYQEIILGLAEQLGYETYGLYTPDYGYGDDIVSVAKQELAYYTANSLHGGARYWNMVEDVLGWTMPSSSAWCCCFVYCCAYQCGYIAEDGPFGPNWVFSVTSSWGQLVTSGRAAGYTTADYRPVPGDLICFGTQVGSGAFTHIGIVDYVDDAGKVHTIEGNTGNKCKAKTYDSYRVGTICYGNVRIAAYMHPNYPAAFTTNPKYLSISGLTAAGAAARYATSGTNKLFLAGLPRFRESQLQDVVTQLKQLYPEIYDEALQTALDNGDMQAFITAWNAIYSSGKLNTFKNAQQSIAAKLYVRPLVQKIKEETGFDWSATDVREELIWAIATTSDRQTALCSLMADITGDMPNHTSDEDLLNALRSGAYLKDKLLAHSSALWPSEADVFRTSWINGILQLLSKL